MAQKRMFDKTIIDSDAFLDMPLTTQALYFHLNMRADDDGFVDNCKSIMRIIGAKEDDLKVLITKDFLIPFESGVIVIKHWKINNHLQKDRIKRTRYIKELSLLKQNNEKIYQLLEVDEKTNIPLTIEKEIPEWQIKRDLAYKNSSLPYSFSYKIRAAFDKEICPVCNREMNCNSKNRGLIPTIQHKIPITQDGKHELENIAIICSSCNSSLGNNIYEGNLNTSEVIKKWNKILEEDSKYVSRLASGNIVENSIEEYRRVENRIDDDDQERPEYQTPSSSSTSNSQERPESETTRLFGNGNQERPDNKTPELSNEILNIFEYLETNFGRTISPTELEIINSYEEIFGTEIIKEAIDRACINNAKTIRYVMGILESWKSKGFSKVEEVKSEFNEIKNKSQKKEPNPEWLDKEIETKEASQEERKEMEELMRNFQ